MNSNNEQQKSRIQLAERIIEAAKQAFLPGNADPKADREQDSVGTSDVHISRSNSAVSDYHNLLQTTPTWTLLRVLNSLIHSPDLPPVLKAQLVRDLTLVPVAHPRDGVRSTLEFVFAVHPRAATPLSGGQTTANSGDSGDDGKSKRARITPEALALATKLFVPPPVAAPSAEAWFRGIRSQLWRMLDGKEDNDQTELQQVAAHILAFGILGRKAYGSPGSPGWRVFVAPLLTALKPSLRESDLGGMEEGDDLEAERDDHQGEEEKRHLDGGEKIIELTGICSEVSPRIQRQGSQLVSAATVQLALRRLQTILSLPSATLCKRLVYPIYLELWALASWPSPSASLEANFCQPARQLLEMYLKLAAQHPRARMLIPHLFYRGERKHDVYPWVFEEIAIGNTASQDTGIRIVKPEVLNHDEMEDLVNVVAMESKASQLADLLVASFTDAEISDLFLDLFTNWFASSSSPHSPEKVTILTQGEQQSSVAQVYEMLVLQALMEKAQEKLVTRAPQILEVANRVLQANRQQRQSDEVVSTALSLVSHVITSPNFLSSELSDDMKTSLEAGLKHIADSARPSRCLHQQQEEEETPWEKQTVQTASNLHLLLRYRDQLNSEETGSSITQGDSLVAEQRRQYQLALSYITDSESPPPVRAEGLALLSALLHARSPVVDGPATLVLLSSLLQQDHGAGADEYVYLRVVRMFVQLADEAGHPTATCKELLHYYSDPQEQIASVDVRLRFGEALLQVIQRQGRMFTGELAREIAHTLLSMAGRRTLRSRTQRQWERSQRRQQRRNQEAKEAWGGDVPQLSESEDSDREEESQSSSSSPPRPKKIESQAARKARKALIAQIIAGWSDERSQRGEEDLRIRASALSVLGEVLEISMHGVGANLASSAVDVSLHLLVLERGLEAGILRRAAVLLVLHFVRALDEQQQRQKRRTRNTAEVNLVLPRPRQAPSFGLTEESRRDMVQTLQYVASTDEDGLVRQHAASVVESLEALPLRQLSLEDDPSSTPSWVDKVSNLAANPVLGISDPEARVGLIEEVE